MIEQTLSGEMLEMANIQQKHEDELLEKNNVVGVALGHRIREREEGAETDEPVLSVLVNQKMDGALLTKEHLVEPTYDGLATDVVETGDIFAGDGAGGAAIAPELVGETATPQLLRRRARPALGGYSVGHYKITAGTLGTCCYDLTPFPGIPERYYILSNNHVLANSNNARIGDPILQPGPYDGGRYPDDVIARLYRFVPIRFISGSSAPLNYVDAAIAEGDFENLNREIYWGGYLKRLYVAPKVGDIVQKTGRTTNFTTGKVSHINATIDVNYGANGVARFSRQIVTTRMGAGGDSGSLVANLEEGAVGLLFAGSATRTIVNNILYVQALLRVRVTEK